MPRRHAPKHGNTERGDKVYVGEITILSSAGLLNYRPKSYDRYWGDHLTLPNRNE